MNAIEVQNLTVRYSRTFCEPFLAVKNLSFSVRVGEIVGFLGLNGAGKTSTIKTILGFQPAYKGQCYVLGVPSNNPKSRKEVGFLPESALYSPYLTPLETLSLYGALGGLSQETISERSEELLIRVGMQNHKNVLNKNLSKGMVQRVGIAQSLLSHPKVLILDEVSSGLDPIGRRDLRVLLNLERDKGATIFLSSHQLNEIESLCDRIIIIHMGELIADINVDDVLKTYSKVEDYFVDVVAKQGEH